MKLTVKTLKGTHFEIKAQPSDTIIAVKKIIEDVQGKGAYPYGHQLLIYNGKVLKDETTLEDSQINEDSFLVVMLSKTKTSGSAGSSSNPLSAVVAAPAPPATPTEASRRASTQVTTTIRAERPKEPVGAYGQAASALVAESNLEQTVNQLLDMGGGSWDRDTIHRALRAAYNNPERAVEYLYSGIPLSAEVAVPVAQTSLSQISSEEPNSNEAGTAPSLAGMPNFVPFNMFSQPQQRASSHGAGVRAGSLEFLRNTPQFQQLREMVRANPQLLQQMLQELSKQHPQLLRLIQEHHAEFLRLLNEPGEEGVEGHEIDLPEEMPHAINVTPAEQDAIIRLEGMGFDRALVIEAFLACDRNEELAANYLLEHASEQD